MTGQWFSSPPVSSKNKTKVLLSTCQFSNFRFDVLHRTDRLNLVTSQIFYTKFNTRCTQDSVILKFWFEQVVKKIYSLFHRAALQLYIAIDSYHFNNPCLNVY